MNKEALIKRIERLRDFAITDYGKGRNEALTSAIDVIRDFEDPAQVDEELEAARQKFPVGSWFTTRHENSAIYKVHKVVRGYYEATRNHIFVYSSDRFNMYVGLCTPFTFPSAPEWHPMSEEPDCPGDYLVRNNQSYVIALYSYSKWYLCGIRVTFPETAQWRAV